MSDAYYRERAARRTRTLLILGALVVTILCVVLGTRGIFYDACTQSFDRSPRSVVLAFVEAVKRGDATTAQECWEHHTYYDLEAGCSQVCLSRIFGAQYQLVDITINSPYTTPDGRANLKATVSIVCTENQETYTGEILLDSVKENVPWKHWAIIHNTFGGTVAEPWCK